MANMVNASPIAFTKHPSPSFSFLSSQPITSSKFASDSVKSAVFSNVKGRAFFAPILAYKNLNSEDIVDINKVELVKENELEEEDSTTDETLMYSFSPLPLMFVAALPGGNATVILLYIKPLFGASLN